MQNRNLKIAATILLGLTAPLWWFVDWWRASDVHGRVWGLLFIAAWAFVVWGQFQEDARNADALTYSASPAGQATAQAMGEARIAMDLADSGYTLDENGEMVALEVESLPTWEAEPPGAKLIRLLNEGVPLETAQAQVHGSGHPAEYNFAAPMPGEAASQGRPSHPCAQLWWPEIVAASEKHGVDPLLILEFMGNESACKEGAMSYVGAQGLMQIMPATGMEIAPRCGEDAARVWEPATNISLGACYIRWLADTYRGGRLKTYDDVFWVAVGYNSGPGRIQSGTVLPETGPYARAIAGAYAGR